MPGRTREAWIIFAEELRRRVRSRWFQVTTAVVVLLLVAALFVVPPLVNGDGGEAPSGPDPAKIGVVDESGGFPALGGSGMGARAAGDTAAGGAGGPRLFDDRAQGVGALARGDIEWLYVVPADYMQSGQVEQYGEFVGRFPSNPGGEAVFRALLVDALLSGQVDPSVRLRVLDPARFESYRVVEDGSVAPLPPITETVGAFMVPLLFAALLGLGLAVGAGTMVQSMSEEKESRLVEVMITSVSPFSLLAGKLLALTVAGLLQAAVWIVAGALILPAMFRRISGFGEFGISGEMWAIIIGCFIAGYLLVTTLGVLVGAVAPSAREAGGAGSWVTILPFFPIWFFSLMMASPDGLLSRVLSYLPLTSPSGILARVSAGGEMAGWQIALSLLGVVALSAVVLWVATRVFRAAILMRGQNATAHNLWGAFRSAG
ncbi:MAG: ABC transporter permease [Gaiellales bacterium]|nr:ABC transporter permease [Gaiellales bacterium]